MARRGDRAGVEDPARERPPVAGQGRQSRSS
jgi:hypothetical protein